MSFAFKAEDFDRISDVLGVAGQFDGACVRYKLHDPASGRRVTLEVAYDLDVPDAVREDGGDTVVTVMAPSSFVQLHGCTGFIASEELGEVIFFGKCAGKTSGLVVEKQAACSLYANIDDRLLSTDFTQLAPELIMSSLALSMTEDLFSNLG